MSRILVSGMSVLLAATLACGPLSSGGTATFAGQTPPSGPSAVTSYEGASVEDLVEIIIGETSLAGAYRATQEVLARAGVATTDFETVFVQARPPAASAVASPDEILHLALDARNAASGGRVTVTELAGMMGDLGWPFDEGSTGGEQVMQMLAAWVNAGKASPEGATLFAPLFLAEMAERRSPAVDLASGTADPEQTWLSLLEIEVFFAGVDRIVSQAAQTTGGRGSPGLAAMMDPGLLAQEGPCTTIQRLLRSPYGNLANEGLDSPVGQEVIDQVMDDPVEEALKAGGISEGSAADVSKALSILGTLARIWKLFVLFASAEVTVTASNTLVHKPLIDGDKYVLYTARAGVSQDDWDEFQEAMSGEIEGPIRRAARDCAQTIGLPVPADIEDIAQEAETWRVEWKVKPDQTHAEIRFGGTHPRDNENNRSEWLHIGQYEARMQRVSPSMVESEMRLTIKNEQESDHPGLEARVRLKICAEVETSQPPSLSTFVNAGKQILGLIDSIVELGAGFLQEMFTPRNCAPLEVTFHERYSLQLDYEFLQEIPVQGGGTTRTEESAFLEVPLSADESGKVSGEGIMRFESRSWLRGRISCTETEIFTVDVKIDGTTDEEAGLLRLNVTFTTLSDESLGLICNPFFSQGPQSYNQMSYLEGRHALDFLGQEGETRLYEAEGLELTFTLVKPGG